MATKRSKDEVAKILGHDGSEVVELEDVDEGVVATGHDGHRVIVFDDDRGPAWFGYGDKPPTGILPSYDPATKTTSRPKPPAKK